MFTFDSGDRLGAFRSAATSACVTCKTDQLPSGIIPVDRARQLASTRPFGQYNEVERDYTDTLPSFNVVFELTPTTCWRASRPRR